MKLSHTIIALGLMLTGTGAKASNYNFYFGCNDSGPRKPTTNQVTSQPTMDNNFTNQSDQLYAELGKAFHKALYEGGSNKDVFGGIGRTVGERTGREATGRDTVPETVGRPEDLEYGTADRPDFFAGPTRPTEPREFTRRLGEEGGTSNVGGGGTSLRPTPMVDFAPPLSLQPRRTADSDVLRTTDGRAIVATSILPPVPGRVWQPQYDVSGRLIGHALSSW